ncbi:MAG: hypothetical protein E7071_05380 [Bacteroidales bacterium]|nr:hypothetical protein [Bacteroidales bacterium]
MDNILGVRVPKFNVNEFEYPTEYLRHIIMEQAEEKKLLIGRDVELYCKRIEYELKAFEQYNAIDYLLDVWNFLHTCKALPKTIIIRGKASASLICYLLGITKFNPVKYELLFSSFIQGFKMFVPLFEFFIGEDLLDFKIKLSEQKLYICEKGEEFNGNNIIFYQNSLITLINKTFDYVNLYKGINISYGNIPIDDPLTFKSFNDGNLVGIPYLQSEECAQTLYELQIVRFDELIPLCAMSWPGISEKLPSYRKYIVNSSDRFLWEKMEQKPPFIIYQEQIIRLALARGFNESEAYLINKCIVRRLLRKLEMFHERWVEASNEDSWEMVINNGLYAYPKSYAIVLAWQAYICAYLKTHFSEEFIHAALFVVTKVF